MDMILRVTLLRERAENEFATAPIEEYEQSLWQFLNANTSLWYDVYGYEPRSSSIETSGTILDGDHMRLQSTASITPQVVFYHPVYTRVAAGRCIQRHSLPLSSVWYESRETVSTDTLA